MNIAFHPVCNVFDNLCSPRDNETCRLPGAGVTQLVECDLAKVDVAGSNPVSRSKIQPESPYRPDSQRNQRGCV